MPKIPLRVNLITALTIEYLGDIDELMKVHQSLISYAKHLQKRIPEAKVRVKAFEIKG